MLEKFAIGVTFERDGQRYIRNSLKNDDYEIIVEEFQNEHLKLLLVPTAPLDLVSLKLTYKFHFEDACRVFLNGYQSWSRSYERTAQDRDVGLNALVRYKPLRKLCSMFGDYDFKNYSQKKGCFHGYTYAYVREEDSDDIILFGSLSETEGFTRFNFDINGGTITIEKDLDGKLAQQPLCVMDIVRIDARYADAFREYFDRVGVARPQGGVTKLTGYTSWYNYFQKINETILLRDLDAMSNAVGKLANLFQIDDGWQTAVGDWGSVDKIKFPRGMKAMADDIHSKGYMAGLWLAPFLAQRKSKLVTEHPDWLITDWQGKPRLANIGWGGAYALDIYNEDAKKYVADCLTTVVGEWGFDLVKLDFLYAECMSPRRGKTRGEIMSDTMDFLRETLGSKLILGCGVPLGSAFGKVDFCRIGSDIALSYKDNFISRCTNKEVVSTSTALLNTVFRRGLSEGAFYCDPDVMILRDTNMSFTFEQKELISKVVSLFGDMVLVSDNMAEYSKEALDAVRIAMRREKPRVRSVFIEDNTIKIDYFENGERLLMRISVIDGKFSIMSI